MLRRLSNVLSILSVVFALAAVVLTAKSYKKSQSLEIACEGRLYAISVSRGALKVDNEPQRQMEDALRNRLDRGIALASIRFYQTNAWLSRLTAEYASRPDADLGQLATRDEIIATIRSDAELRRAQLGRLQAFPPSTASAPWSKSYRCWMIDIASGLPCIMIVTARGFRRLRVMRRHSRGLCGVCGYDLRASKDFCPECGTPIPIKSDYAVVAH